MFKLSKKFSALNRFREYSELPLSWLCLLLEYVEETAICLLLHCHLKIIFGLQSLVNLFWGSRKVTGINMV